MTTMIDEKLATLISMQNQISDLMWRYLREQASVRTELRALAADDEQMENNELLQRVVFFSEDIESLAAAASI